MPALTLALAHAGGGQLRVQPWPRCAQLAACEVGAAGAIEGVGADGEVQLLLHVVRVTVGEARSSANGCS